MAMPETNQANITYLMTVGGSLIAIILALVAVIYHGIKERLDGHQEALDDGNKAFNEHLVQAEATKENIASVRTWLINAEYKMKAISAEHTTMQRSLDKIAIYHPQHHPGEKI